MNLNLPTFWFLPLNRLAAGLQLGDIPCLFNLLLVHHQDIYRA